MVNKDYLVSIIGAIFILLSWLLVSYIGSSGNNFPEIKSITVPFVWGCLFVYLHEKRHTYLALNSYVIFLLFVFADRLSFKLIPNGVHTAYLIVSIFSVFLFILVYQNLLTKNKRLASIFAYIVTVSLYALPLFYIIYAFNFSSPVSREVFYAILQTNLSESLEFARDYISIYWLLIILIANLVISFLLLRQEKKESIYIESALLIFFVSIFFVLSIVNREQVRIYSFAKNTIFEYWNEIDKFRQTQDSLKSDQIKFSAEKDEGGETYIVVVGESLNKENMGLYGYVRDTSPSLSKHQKSGELLTFKSAFSIHTHTMLVLSQALTESNQSNQKKYFDSLSILNILNKADVKTSWVTNQQITGEWDNLVSVIAHQADDLVAMNRSIGRRVQTQEFDGVLVEKVKEILDTDTDKNRVVFVHLMGSHGDYCQRYPKKFEHFSGDVNKSYFGSAQLNGLQQVRLNCYDNSVLYNDYVVSSLISLLNSSDDVNGLVFFSDHADDVISGLGHNSSNFTFEMTQIPLVVWLSDAYKSKYKEKYSSLKKNINELFPNDRIYDTLIGLFSVETENYQAVNDLSSSAYYIDDNASNTLHGEVLYSSSDNHYYHQRKNASYLQKSKQSSRIIPHRVNSIGKLKDVWFEGLRAFEIDVRFGDHGSSKFVLGHDYDIGEGGMTFETFLSSVAYGDIKRIWVDFKNLTESNHEDALAELERLDVKFNLKDKLIIESGTTKDFFNKFQKGGWHTSYYMPTAKIVELISENHVAAMKDLAKKISVQTKRQKLSAVSFDRRLYPFVKEYLEQLISNDVVYHTWDLPLKLFDRNFQREIFKKEYYDDQRVETILLHFKSPYNL